jgi:hypothetical protein
MHRRHVDRRPAGEPVDPGAGKHDPNRPAPDRKAPEAPQGHPIDKPTPQPGAPFGGKNIFDDDRSDRESGRPVQLEDDDTDETIQPGRADAGPGLGGRQEAGRKDRRSGEVEPTKR